MPVFPRPHHQGKISCIAEVSSPLAIKSKGWGDSPASVSSGLGLLHLDFQGQLYCVAQAWHRGQYPVYGGYGGTGPAPPLLLPQGHLLSTSGIDGWWGRGEASLPYPCHHMTDS